MSFSLLIVCHLGTFFPLLIPAILLPNPFAGVHVQSPHVSFSHLPMYRATTFCPPPDTPPVARYLRYATAQVPLVLPHIAHKRESA